MARGPKRPKFDPATLALRAAEMLKRQALRECFSADDLASRPTGPQLDALRGVGAHLIRYILSGNQCLPGETLVMTPRGPRRIDDLQVGDTVYDENGQEQKVVRTWQNGEKEVGDLTARGRTLAACTAEHKWWTNLYSHADGELLQTRKVQAAEFSPDDSVARTFVRAPLGDVDVPDTYALGAFLGDGCSRERGRRFHISSSDCGVPEKVAAILGGTATKQKGGNYTWIVDASQCTYYDEWCRGRYAHEKTADLTVISTWNRRSLLNFVAGLLDTDGSVHKAKDHVTLELTMQAKPVVDAFEYAVLALWNIQLSRSLDNRAKYKNGPVHEVYTRNVHEVRRILSELDEYTVKPTRKWQAEYDALGGRRSRPDAIHLTWGANRRKVQTYDITVSGKNNVYLLANGLVTSNSGKTALAVREGVWIFDECHPYFPRPKEWGSGPLLGLVVGQDRAQMDNIWNTRFKPLLAEPEKWKEQRNGGALISVRHVEKGHQLVFLSHNNSSESDIAHLQYYSAHWVWCDEMPKSIRVLEELQRRIDAHRGRFICTFTMKYRNDKIRRLVDASDGEVARVYRLKKLDNPVYRGRESEELAKIAALPPELQAAILEGKWITSDTKVYLWDADLNSGTPAGYNPSWRHVVSVDPATESKLGLTVWAECPTDGMWWCVVAEYVEGIYVPSLIVEAVEKRVAGLNVVKRIYDTEAAWFARQARHDRGVTYVGVYGKSGKKETFISDFQTALSGGVLADGSTVLPTVRIATWCQKLVDEIESCERNESTDKVANSSKYHLIDSAHYFVALKPPREKIFNYSSRDEYLIKMDDLRREKEHKAAVAKARELLKRRRRTRVVGGGRGRPWVS